MYLFLLLLENDSFIIIFCVMDVSVVSYSIVVTEDGNIELWLIGACIESVVGLYPVTNKFTEPIFWYW